MAANKAVIFAITSSDIIRHALVRQRQSLLGTHCPHRQLKHIPLIIVSAVIKHLMRSAFPAIMSRWREEGRPCVESNERSLIRRKHLLRALDSSDGGAHRAPPLIKSLPLLCKARRRIVSGCRSRWRIFLSFPD